MEETCHLATWDHYTQQSSTTVTVKLGVGLSHIRSNGVRYVSDSDDIEFTLSHCRRSVY